MKKRKPRANQAEKFQEALKNEREKSNEYLNRLKYLQADFENYRKRTEKRISETIQISNEELIFSLLNVMDELELALRSGRETENTQAILEGVGMTLKKLSTALEQKGLARIEAVGKVFNPTLHEILMKVPTEEHDENVIIEEVRTGYMLRDKVIRPSIVKVASRSGVE
ncbi:MAG: nucleotide exchange factor GrpE [Candidatus Bathyarchaeota archaeon]|nr:MAG: nucleotide exchange factor GrpE [Candidatus Bathyarchaeota archaeon]